MKNQHLPRHIAVIMDGNGRWAKKRFMPRIAGHKAGAETVRRMVKACAERGVEVLTLFAFSSENWQRPQEEVSYLMQLFITLLRREIKRLHEQNVKLEVIGERSRFNEKLQNEMNAAEHLTQYNTGLKLIIAANYGGRWDICRAVKRSINNITAGHLRTEDLTPEKLSQHMTLNQYPRPDLLIRTSGEKRLSNFMLWQLAEAELYFTDLFWPDFNDAELEKALEFYRNKDKNRLETAQVVSI